MPGKPLGEGIEIRDGREADVEALLPLLRGYCDFYEVSPPDSGLRELADTVIADPAEGSLFVAEEGGALIGFAVMGMKWVSTRGSRAGHLEDLFVSPDARGKGVADALIARCAERCRELGGTALGWITATDNHRAQQVYDRVGGMGSTWMEYELEL
ncbi:MAG: GNAT family N-acetyltransferase [Actinobacteria bacterium]|nr:GNAT family N-acetyltransferase [Actinomycetota bacterium]